MLRVLMPAQLSHTGEARWDTKAVDSCIADIMDALNAAGIFTANSCCGHGKSDGGILLHDGRELVIKAAADAAKPPNGGNQVGRSDERRVA